MLCRAASSNSALASSTRSRNSFITESCGSLIVSLRVPDRHPLRDKTEKPSSIAPRAAVLPAPRTFRVHDRVRDTELLTGLLLVGLRGCLHGAAVCLTARAVEPY